MEAGSEADVLQAPWLSAEEGLTPGCHRDYWNCGRGSTQSRRQYMAGCTRHLRREMYRRLGRRLLTGSQMQLKPALKLAAVTLFQRAGKSVVDCPSFKPTIQPSKHNLDFQAIGYLYYIVHTRYIFFYAFEPLRNS